jgi:hypothetical protein
VGGTVPASATTAGAGDGSAVDVLVG